VCVCVCVCVYALVSIIKANIIKANSCGYTYVCLVFTCMMICTRARSLARVRARALSVDSLRQMPLLCVEGHIYTYIHIYIYIYIYIYIRQMPLLCVEASAESMRWSSRDEWNSFRTRSPPLCARPQKWPGTRVGLSVHSSLACYVCRRCCGCHICVMRMPCTHGLGTRG